MGSLGRQVAEETALRLGFRLVWRDLINQAARRAGVPEVALATIDELGILGLKPSRNDQQAYQHAVRQVMNELSAEGNVVIIGRAGQVILQDAPGFLHVRVIAPKEVRIKRTMLERGIAYDSAMAMVEKSDLYREQYLQQNYHAKLSDPGWYDLVINTSHYKVGEAAEIICVGFRNLAE